MSLVFPYVSYAEKLQFKKKGKQSECVSAHSPSLAWERGGRGKALPCHTEILPIEGLLPTLRSSDPFFRQQLVQAAARTSADFAPRSSHSAESRLVTTADKAPWWSLLSLPSRRHKYIKRSGTLAAAPNVGPTAAGELRSLPPGVGAPTTPRSAKSVCLISQMRETRTWTADSPTAPA